MEKRPRFSAEFLFRSTGMPCNWLNSHIAEDIEGFRARDENDIDDGYEISRGYDTVVDKIALLSIREK